MTRTQFLSSGVLSIAIAALLAGCVADGVLGDDDTVDSATLPALLAAAPELAVDPAQSAVAVHASLDRGDRVDEADIVLLVEHGAATVTGDAGELAIDLTLAFHQVALPSDIHPGDLRLIDISVTALTPLRCQASWTSDIAWCGGTLDVQLDWSLAEGDAVYPLGSQPLRGLTVDAAALLTGDTLTLQLAGDTEGLVWSWAGIAELRDLSLRVTASGAATLPR